MDDFSLVMADEEAGEELVKGDEDGCKDDAPDDVDNHGVLESDEHALVLARAEVLRGKGCHGKPKAYHGQHGELIDLPTNCLHGNHISTHFIENDLHDWNTSAVTTMSNMFIYNRKLSVLNTNSWDTGAVTNMSYMFYDTRALSEIQGIENWDTGAVTDMSFMFSRYDGLTTLATLDLRGWDVSNVTTMASMFNGANGLTTLNVTGWQPGLATTGVNLTSLFEGTSKLQTLTGIDTWDTTQATTMNRMFQGIGTTAPGVTSLDLSGWNVSNVTTMASMFNGANKLQTLDTTGWNPEKVTTMNSMFYNATALNTITGTANWQTDAVTNLGYTFVGTALTNLDLSGWNTAAVTNMGYTFNNSPLVTIDLKGWTTASITANYAMECMFQNTSALTNLDMRTADFDKATTVYPNMFRGSNIGGTTMIVKDDAVINDLTVRLNLSPRPFNIITP